MAAFTEDVYRQARTDWDRYVAQLQRNAAPDSLAMQMESWDDLPQWIRDEWAEDVLRLRKPEITRNNLR